jgi:ABC-2 type transport system permease protein
MSVWSEILLVFHRQLRIATRELEWSALAMLQPLLYLVLFGPMLRPLGALEGFPRGDPWSVFVPGLLVQLGMFGTLFSGFGLLAEIRNGVVERMRVTPVRRVSLLLGRVLRDALILVAQALLMLLAAWALGLRAPLSGLLVVLGLVASLGVALSCLSYTAALRLRSEESLAQALNSVVAPVLLLSGFLLPMSLAPRWLYLVSRLNPFSHIVDAARAATRGDFADASIAVGAIVALVFAGASVVVGTRTFSRESR